MKKIIAFVLGVSLLLPQSCVNPATVKTATQLASLGIEVVTLLKNCAELSHSFSTKVGDVNDGLEQGIKNNKSQLDLAKYWEKYWGDIHQDFDNLKGKLFEADRVSQQYFAEFDNNNSQISNAATKLEYTTKATKMKEEYKTEYQKAVVSINNSEKLLKDGDDVLLVLRNEVLINALNNQITVLKNISSQSNVLSQKMKNFSNTCIPLFTQNK